ncbi:sensor histidine kinase [Aphanothece minutissima]|uniref:histidine kinase n=1 Tax=Aphanothece cf. minutissima CCALA 015 TaxID=2107695 RepID=A0ABX5F6A4_9CHRO|nr:histidine kinase dimerization/phospho-acceptor domain-containing protein [Aphanothece minutissima]PSB37047.1 histidine kinase [Aphanothece cf. minutissima CCALA 015]
MVVSLGDLRRLLAAGVPAGRGDEDSVRRQWWAALATLQADLLGAVPPQPGVWLAAPLPALYEPSLLEWLDGWVWTPAEVDNLMPPGLPLLPGMAPLPPPHGTPPRGTAGRPGGFQRLSLREEDGTDPLLVLITPVLQVALALDGPPQERRLVARFDAPVLSAALELLDRRLAQDDPVAGLGLRRRLQLLGPLSNDPDLGSRFWPLLAQRLAAMAPSVTLQPLVHGEKRSEGSDAGRSDAVSSELALLEALTHEVRTPLATIRTLIRSLLRRTDLPAVVRQRLEQIDGECSEQIDRFGLIFLAAELQRQPGSGQPLSDSELARTDLSRLLVQLEELWQRQLGRRDLRLVLEIAADLPPVMSDPSRLETMLGGLMDRFSRSLPSGSEVRLRLLPAGSRLKLQLSSDDPESREVDALAAAVPTPVGPVLSWNPETGSLQLSRQATQRLFHRLGGRLTERGGSNLTVFFPTAERSG